MTQPYTKSVMVLGAVVAVYTAWRMSDWLAAVCLAALIVGFVATHYLRRGRS